MPETNSHPHVLLVCTDHWPGHFFGHRGNDQVLTPTLDELAAGGRAFTRAYSECPVCIPARRTLMTGTAPRTHGDREFKNESLMPDFPSLAQSFSDQGYQTMAVGKLHVQPQRDRIGFDDVLLSEEGRIQFGVTDDYEAFLADNGHPGAAFTHTMGNNQYHVAPWHLPDEFHVTNWATKEMCRQIKRRDPTRPGLWYLSYVHPHPPLAALDSYMDFYRHVDFPETATASWSQSAEQMPAALRSRRLEFDRCMGEKERQWAMRSFAALCTHIDHQLRLVLGTLREEGVLDNTIVLFTADHGDMLGDHGLWAKRLFYEGSGNVPMILSAPGQNLNGQTDDRPVGLQDVMPTLLNLAGLQVPDSVDGRCMVHGERREYLYGEISEAERATRMVHDGRYKMIYYPAGNNCQLFDLENDPRECTNLLGDPQHADAQSRLQAALQQELYGGDEAWVTDGALVGLPDMDVQEPIPSPGLQGQRGWH